MIPEELIAQVKQIRAVFERSLEVLEQVQSFQLLLGAAGPRRDRWNEIKDALKSPRFRRSCDGRIVCAIVGASNHGKTTTLEEMFPGLRKRGWLVTESNDTTSQSLRIEYAPAGSPEALCVFVHSWDLPQVIRLVRMAEAENRRLGVETEYKDDVVVVDGTKGKLNQTAFKFPLRQELRQFPQPYEVTSTQAADAKFIRALTIKELSEKIDADLLLPVGGQAYNTLQLRAVVKEVTLRDSYERIVHWSGLPGDPPPAERLVFIDTPGLGTDASAKDEVLMYCLAHKSPRIVLQLLENDELDIVLHLVLCGEQSTFGRLWQAVEEERGRREIEDLVAERLFVVINGVNRYFKDPTLDRKWNPERAAIEGDPFDYTIRDNILQKMVPGEGQARPAGIYFIDSIQHLSQGDPDQYRSFYEDHKGHLLRALEPGGVGHETVKALGLDQTLEENVQALSDPEDCGHGFLIRQIVRLVQQKGPAIFLQRHLVRTDLLAYLQQLRGLLAYYYEDDGTLRLEMFQETLRRCLAFLEEGDNGDQGEFAGIEAFCQAHVDEHLTQLAQGKWPTSGDEAERGEGERLRPGRRKRGALAARDNTTWALEAYRRMCSLLEEAIIMESKVDAPVAKQFRDYFRERTRDWSKQWGYESARLLHPDQETHRTDHVVLHCLRFHAREILYQLLIGEAQGGIQLEQSEQEREQLAAVLKGLDEAIALGEQLCRAHRVGGQA